MTGIVVTVIDGNNISTFNTGTPGLSAYELWLAEGNTGTLSQFIATAGGNLQPQIDAANAAAAVAEAYAMTLEVNAAGGFYNSLSAGVADADVAVGEAFNIIEDGRHLVGRKTGATTGEIIAEYTTNAVFGEPDGSGKVGFSHAENYSPGTAGRKMQQSVNPTDAPYFATVNGTTNDRDAFQAAIDRAKAQGVPFEWNGTARIEGTLDMGEVEIRGASQDQSIIKAVGNFDLFKINGSWTKLSGFRVDNTLKTGGDDIVFDLPTSGGSVEHDFEDLFFDGSRGCVREIYTSGDATQYRTYFRRVKWTKVSDNGIRHTRGFAYIYYDAECSLEKLGGSNPNFTAFKYDGTGLPVGAGGLHLGLTVVGDHGHASADWRDIGFEIEDAAAVYFLPLSRAENCKGRGLKLLRVTGAHFNGLGVYHCGGLEDIGAGLANASVLWKDSTYLYGDAALTINGRRSLGGGATNSHGLLIKGGDNIPLPWVASDDNTGSGIMQDGANVAMISTAVCRGNGRYGIEGSTTAGVFRVKGGLLAGNVLGNVNLGHAQQIVNAVTVNSGAELSFSGPVVG